MAALPGGVDQSPRMLAQRRVMEAHQLAPREVAQRKSLDAIFAQPLQRQPATTSNQTGLPDSLKSGIESISGMDMSDVRVHRNSGQPAQLNALAYAKGNDIHIGPGQESHLPHEAWHVVQQRQGRVQATTQMAGVGVNNDQSLEKEADQMGARALAAPTQLAALGRGESHEDAKQSPALSAIQKMAAGSNVVQRGRVKDLQDAGQSYSRVIKVIMAGSGNDTISGGEPKGERIDKDHEPTAWVVEDLVKTTLSVAGPGAPSSKGPARYVSGISDTGSNSINNNVLYVINILGKLIAASEPGHSILILIKAHSRNAVSATRIANFIQGKDGKDGKHLEIELVLFDPVPGPLHYGDDAWNDVSKIPESTLVSSVATQYIYGFTPQRVFGAKRIIISRQNHSGGLKKGYQYQNKTYKGSRLNSLPGGLYADFNSTDESSKELKRMLSIEDAKRNLKTLYNRSESLTRDLGAMGFPEDAHHTPFLQPGI